MKMTDDHVRIYVTYTLVDTPFQLISGFFHVNEVFCVLSMLNKLPPAVCWGGGVLGGGGGGGGNRLAT